MRNRRIGNEEGVTLVIVAISIVAITAMLVLTGDGSGSGPLSGEEEG